jgi:structural maintenance of chromosome 2
MFNNANVIYRTKFVDGVSTVARTIGVGSSSRARALASEENVGGSPVSRKKPARGVGRNRGKENTVV